MKKDLAAAALGWARSEWRTLVAVIWGNVALCAGVMLFTVPVRLPDIGVVGAASLLNYAFGISIPLVSGVVNSLLLLFAWRELSRHLFVWTVISVLISTVMLKLMEGLPTPPPDDRLLIALIGGALKGYGIGTMIRVGASSGGTDIIVLYAKKRWGVDSGALTNALNMIVIIASVFVVGAENAMLGVVSVFVCGIMIDRTISSFDRRRQVLIITKTPDPIVSHITEHIGRSSTIIPARGGFSHDDIHIIMCVLSRRQSADLRRYLADAHPGTFMVVSDASEVLGRGFKSWKE